MVDVMALYIDDSGTRHPDHKPSPTPHGLDWFGYGGVIVRDDDRPTVEAAYDAFRARWKLRDPLHSNEIRQRSKHFAWLELLQQAERDRFMNELTELVTMKELTVIAAVVDRPGYNDRYRATYGRHRWSLCKTAFSIVVERSAKYAASCGCKLRVYVENTNADTDKKVKAYYDELRASGQPFNQVNSGKYNPLGVDDLRTALYEFGFKRKTSRLMQLADICLWPVCRGAYDPTVRAYEALKNAGTLIDCKLDPTEIEKRGIKRSCFELYDHQGQAQK